MGKDYYVVATEWFGINQSISQNSEIEGKKPKENTENTQSAIVTHLSLLSIRNLFNNLIS